MQLKKRHLKAEALSSVRKGDFDRAIERYNEYLQFNPEDCDAWSGLGGAYRRKDDLDKAIESYEKAYAIEPSSTYALVNIVSLCAARNAKADYAKIKKYLPIAERLTKQIIDAEKADYWTWYDLATLQLIKGDTNAAIRTFSFAADLTPKTAKENYKSVLSNLSFLQQHNPTINGLANVMAIIKRYSD